MLHLFIKVINIEIGTKHFIQPETIFSQLAEEQAARRRVSLVPLAGGKARGVLLVCRGGDTSKASPCLC